MSVGLNSLNRIAAVYSDTDDEDTSEEPTSLPGDREKGVKRTRDGDIVEDPPEKSRMKLEIPADVLDMFKQSEVSTELPNSSDHDGRVRSFEHFPGNWATHILVPFSVPDSFSEFVASLKHVWPAEASQLHVADLDDLHVSISRTVPIRHYWIDPLKQFLQRGLNGKRRFVCDFATIGVYVNDEKTRTFLALEVDQGTSQLRNLVTVVDKAFLEFGLPKYYEKPSFHASFAWCLGDMPGVLQRSLLNKMQALFDSYVEDNSPLTFTAKEIQYRTGNKIFKLSLKNERYD